MLFRLCHFMGLLICNIKYIKSERESQEPHISYIIMWDLLLGVVKVKIVKTYRLQNSQRPTKTKLILIYYCKLYSPYVCESTRQ